MRLQHLNVFFEQNQNREHPHFGGIRTMIMFRRDCLPPGADSCNLGRGWTIEEAYRDLRERTRRQAGIDIGHLDKNYDAPRCGNCRNSARCTRKGLVCVAWRNDWNEGGKMRLAIIDDQGEIHDVLDEPIEEFDLEKDAAQGYILGSLANEIERLKKGGQ